MTLKKNLLLGALALGALAQTPVFAPAKKLNVPTGIKTKVALHKTLGWFFNKPQVATYSTNERFEHGDKYDADGKLVSKAATEAQAVSPFSFGGTSGSSAASGLSTSRAMFSRRDTAQPSSHDDDTLTSSRDNKTPAQPGDDTQVDIKSVSFVDADETNEKNICAIPLLDKGFKAPAHLAIAAVLSALVARIIEGEASVTDYAKTAGYSFAGAMAASVLDDGTTWLKNKAKTPAKQMQSKPTENKKSKTAFQIGRFLQFVAFFAGQNPEVVKAMLASIKNGTAGKDLNDFILSLGKDSKQRPRIAAFVRNFGPHIAYMIHNI